MIDRDRIAYLQELAISHFNDGNTAAAVSAWRQVLEMDPANVEAQKGLALAEQPIGAPSAGPFGGSDEDVAATVTFTPDQMAQLGAPATPLAAPFGSDFDADRTMVLGATGGASAPAPPPAFDPDRTMQFGASGFPQASPPAAPAAPAAPAGGFDADSTMLFRPPAGAPPPPSPAGGFDAESTMLFGGTPPAARSAAPPPAPPPAAPPPAAGGFDAERTLLFGGPPPPAPPPPASESPAWPGAGAPAAAPGGDFDADSTMIFAPPAAGAGEPSAPPPPPAPSDWLGGAMGGRMESSDSTVMSPEAPGSSAPAPPPAPLAFDKAPAGGRPLEDFALPSGGLEMAGAPPPMAPPPSAPSSGFSFELPPPPPAKGGGAFSLPELPSLGPPPTFAPAPVPPPVPAAPKKSGAQFGEVDAGEAEALAVPTIGVKHEDAGPPATPADAQAREEELRRSYEQQYGRSAAPGAPPRAGTFGPAAAPKSRIGLYVVFGFVVLMGATWLIIQYVLPESRRVVEVVPVKKDPNAGLSKEAAQKRIIETVAKASEAIRQGDITGAAKMLADSRDIALKAGIPVPAPVDQTATELENERAYRSKFDKALGRFCAEDYSTANILFVELEQARPGDRDPGSYVERIYYNLAIAELQKKEPWESVFYFENLLMRNPGDTEASDLLAFAKKWPVGSDLGYQYTKRVDPLVDRTAGCR